MQRNERQLYHQFMFKLYHSMHTISTIRKIHFLVVLILITVFGSLSAQVFQLQSSSFLGDNTSTDQVVGTRIQSDGTVVLAVNTVKLPVGITPLLLNGTTSASAGTIVRLGTDGTTLLSATKIANQLTDLALDSLDNIYVACASEGFVKLNANATTLILQKTNGSGCHRIDASSTGTIAAMYGDGIIEGKISVYSNTGNLLSEWNGKSFMQDIAISEHLQRVFYLGFKNANTADDPVQICYMICKDFSGVEKWRDYDWPGYLMDSSDGIAKENNMADTRAYRVSMGADGKLYATFEAAGGNHIFRFNPHILTQPVTVVGGDSYFNFFNTRDEHKSFFARFDPQTGDYLLGQQLCARLNNGTVPASALRVKDGEIQADENGNVYLTGSAAEGLPLTFDHPISGSYTGGGYFIAISSDFTRRLYCTRLGPKNLSTVSVRTINGTKKISIGGKDVKFFNVNPLQASLNGGTSDRVFAVYKIIPNANEPIINITTPTDNAAIIAGKQFTFNASATHTSGISRVELYKNEELLSTLSAAPYNTTVAIAATGSFLLKAVANSADGMIGTSNRVTLNVNPDAENLLLDKTIAGYSYQQGGNEVLQSYRQQNGYPMVGYSLSAMDGSRFGNCKRHESV